MIISRSLMLLSCWCIGSAESGDDKNQQKILSSMSSLSLLRTGSFHPINNQPEVQLTRQRRDKSGSSSGKSGLSSGRKSQKSSGKKKCKKKGGKKGKGGKTGKASKSPYSYDPCDGDDSQNRVFEEVESVRFQYNGGSNICGNFQGQSGGDQWGLILHSPAAFPSITHANITNLDNGSPVLLSSAGEFIVNEPSLLGDSSAFRLSDSQSGQLLADVYFDTSCSSPFHAGDIFGFLSVTDIVLVDGVMQDSSPGCGGDGTSETSSCGQPTPPITTPKSSAPSGAPISAVPQLCQDNPTFVDNNGFVCSDWVGNDCRSADTVFGYSPDQRDDIIINCPESCSLCPNSPSRSPTDAPRTASPSLHPSTGPSISVPTSSPSTAINQVALTTQELTTVDTTTQDATRSTDPANFQEIDAAICSADIYTMIENGDSCGTEFISSLALKTSTGFVTSFCNIYSNLTNGTIDDGSGESMEFNNISLTVQPTCKSNENETQRWQVCSFLPSHYTTRICQLTNMQCCQQVSNNDTIACREFGEGECGMISGYDEFSNTLIPYGLHFGTCVGEIPKNRDCQGKLVSDDQATLSNQRAKENSVAFGVLGFGLILLATGLALRRIRNDNTRHLPNSDAHDGYEDLDNNHFACAESIGTNNDLDAPMESTPLLSSPKRVSTSSTFDNRLPPQYSQLHPTAHSNTPRYSIPQTPSSSDSFEHEQRNVSILSRSSSLVTTVKFPWTWLGSTSPNESDVAERINVSVAPEQDTIATEATPLLLPS